MRRFLLLLAATSAGIFGQPVHAQRTELKTALIAQQTPFWCWAAAASMALKLLDFPDIDPGRNYQCGVVVAAFPGCEEDCRECVTRLGPLYELVGALDRYKRLADRINPRSDAMFDPNYVEHPQLSRVKRSIDLSHPVLAGISPNGAPEFPARAQHVVLITGYDDDHRGTGEGWVTVIDPYPYARGENPYRDYRFRAATGSVQLPWRVLRDELNLSSAVFLETRSA